MSSHVRSRDRDFFSQQKHSMYGSSSGSKSAASAVQKCAVGEKKRLKVQFIPNNPNGQPNNFNLQINPKTWPNLRVNDILEVSAEIKKDNNLSGSLSLTSGSQQSSVSRGSSGFNQATFTGQQKGDRPVYDDDTSPILLQVVQASLNEQLPIDSIRIDSIASSAPFSFKSLAYVNVTVVERSAVTLDLVELLFKDQYFNGNDMLRFKKYMVNSCVYLKKIIEFCGMRCSVREMWAPNGDIVTCGYISEKTRLVFRAQSAMCTIYIQMSREMWEFDVNGEMYHEKAVNFLGELFTNWKNQACAHDVTIALFSRIFYDAKSKDEFPTQISERIQDNKSENKDNKSRFYEDFYRVIYQNERFEDWTPTLMILKRLIKEYRDYILNYHQRTFSHRNFKMPSAVLSSAAEGNFLETLILSSSVFERHFIDRPMDRTGSMSLVITPGNGLFKVPRKLSKTTKDRVIDNAIGSDLVCLGEQPLHSVPLFKYETNDSYDVPHWINLSFYKSSETVRFCNSKFLPSSKIKIKQKSSKIADSKSILPDYFPDKSQYQKSLEETDDMFANLPAKSINSDTLSVTGRKAASRVSTFTNLQNSSQLSQSLIGSNKSGGRRAGHSMSSGFDEDLQSINTMNLQGDDDFDGNSSFELDPDSESQLSAADVTGSTSSIYRRSLALCKVNPFAPSSFKPRMSFERRRWAHAFPLRSDGTPIFEQWTSVQTQNELENLSTFSSNYSNNNDDIKNISPDSKVYLNQYKTLSRINESSMSKSKKPMLTNKAMNLKSNFSWEIVHKNESKSFMRSGVAWKSLTTPACLPLTTDYFPNESTWYNKFERSSEYILMLDEIREQYGCPQNEHKISMEQVFYELVGHRLAMGFQMVVPKDTFTYMNKGSQSNSSLGGGGSGSNEQSFISSNNMGLASANSEFICDLNSSTSIVVKGNRKAIKGYYKLSLGRIYHELFYINPNSSESGQDYVQVEIYMPKTKHSTSSKEEDYWYRFQVPDSKTYELSSIKLTNKNSESIKWNKIDSYICIQGNGSLTPSQLTKCWRQRIYLIPFMYTNNKLTCKQPPSNSQKNSSQLQPLDKAGSDGAHASSQTSPPESSAENQATTNAAANSSSNSQPSESESLNRSQAAANESMDASIFVFNNIHSAGIYPASMLELNVPVRGDIYSRKSPEELRYFRDYFFIRFMEGLNKLNRADDRRYLSQAVRAYSESVNSQAHSLNDQSVPAVQFIMSTLSNSSSGSSSSSTGTNTNLSSSQKLVNTLNIPKNIQSPCAPPKKLTSPKVKLYDMVSRFLAEKEANDKMRAEIRDYMTNEYVSHMMSPDGIPFFEKKNDIPLHCFISAESVWWCIDHIVDIDVESDAVIFMQILCDFDMIRHISEDLLKLKYSSNNYEIMTTSKIQKVFIHGFYLYYVVCEQNAKNHKYTKDYCEVGFCDLDLKARSPQPETNQSLLSVNNLISKDKRHLPISATDFYKSYMNLYSEYSAAQLPDVSPDSILKLVNVDVDPGRKSNRNEWASAVYRSHYHQLCAFELEIQWEVATGQLLAELMNYWCKLSTRFNYHIVAAPIDPFAMPIVPNSDPLRGPIKVKLNYQCLIQNEKVLFENMIDKVMKLVYEEPHSDDLNLGSNLAVSLSTVDQLAESNPEFMQFLSRKHAKKSKDRSTTEEIRDVIRKKISDDSEFVENEYLEFLECKRIFRLQFFQEAILEKYGFVRNAAMLKTDYSEDDPSFFIHSSGGMFVCLPDYYTNYYTNRSRHTSSNSMGGASRYNSTVTTANQLGIKAPLLNTKHQVMRTHSEHTSANTPASFQYSASNAKQQDNNSMSPSECESKSESVTKDKNKESTGTDVANSRLDSYSIDSKNSVQNDSGGMAATRERSGNRSQQVQFLKSSEKDYLSETHATDTNESSDSDTEERSTSEAAEEMESQVKEDEVKNDLLFRPSTTDLRLSAKSNEKLDLIQQQQREQMLLQSTTPTQSSHLDDQMASSLTDSCFLASLDNDKKHVNSPMIKKSRVPFYSEPDSRDIGFIWSWNFMLGKRWRTPYTGDETFQDNMLADFKIFCSNKDGRLLKFFNECNQLLD